jgi:uncharacterized protein
LGSQHIPKRRCLGCGAQAPKHDLVRFVAVLDDDERRLVRDDPARHPGRGLYVCRRLACFDRAVERRAFLRAARLDGVPLRIDTTLADAFDG